MSEPICETMKIISAELQYIGHFNVTFIVLDVRRKDSRNLLTIKPARFPELLTIADVEVGDDGTNMSELVGKPIIVKYPNAVEKPIAIGNVYDDTKWMEIK